MRTAREQHDGGSWRRFAAEEGRVEGALFVPSEGKDLPLVVALHGCKQTAGDFAIGTGFAALAAREGFAVLFPESHRGPETKALNPFGCWLWWARENQGRGGEPAEIIALVDAVGAGEARIDVTRVYVTGLSSGAAMTTILGSVYPDRVAAIAPHAGVAFGAAEVNTPRMPSWLTGGAGTGGDLLTYSPLNMMKLASWTSKALDVLEEADGRAEEDAAKALIAREGAHGRLPVLIVHGDEDDVVDKAHARQLLLQSLQIADLVDNDADDQSVDTRADDKEEGRAGPGDYPFVRWDYHDSAGDLVARLIRIAKLAHAWSGGSAAGSFTDPDGPDATALTWAFFREAAHLHSQRDG